MGNNLKKSPENHNCGQLIIIKKKTLLSFPDLSRKKSHEVNKKHEGQFNEDYLIMLVTVRT